VTLDYESYLLFVCCNWVDQFSSVQLSWRDANEYLKHVESNGDVHTTHGSMRSVNVVIVFH